MMAKAWLFMFARLAPVLSISDSDRKMDSPLLARGHVAVVGAGFAGLAAACELRKLGYDVTIFEQQDQVGGRDRMLEIDGFKFDAGPSWYWMPDIFEAVFKRYGHAVSDFYNVTLLDPAYRIELPAGHRIDVPGTLEGLRQMVSTRTKAAVGEGTAGNEAAAEAVLALDLFFAEAKIKYLKGVYDLCASQP